MLESSRKPTVIKKGIDHAVLSVGESHSKFYGIGECKLERDERYPIRLTLQYYQVTDESSVPEEIYAEINDKINYVYKNGVAQGSLVTEKETGRTTESIFGKTINEDVSMEQRTQAPLMQFL